MNPGLPWLSPEAIAYCARTLGKSTRALEFGSGRSTVWFGQRVFHLTSIEHSEKWYGRVRSLIARKGLTNIDYRLVPLDHPEAEPEQQQYISVPSYVRVLASFPDESFHLIIVDGHYRSTCIGACPQKLARGGLLLVDDVDMWGGVERVPVSKDWQMVHWSGNGLKHTAIWQKPGADLEVSPA